MRDLIANFKTMKFHAADWAAGATAGIAGSTWLADLNALLQLGITILAVVTGVYAIRWHRVKIKLAEQELRNEQSDGRPTGSTSRSTGEEPAGGVEEVRGGGRVQPGPSGSDQQIP